MFFKYLRPFFTWLYMHIISLFYHGQANQKGVYKQQLFFPVGWHTILMALALVMVFYFIFNNARFSLNQLGWSRPKHWLLAGLLVAGLGALTAYRETMQVSRILSVEEGSAPFEPNAYFLSCFIIANALVAMLWFLILSLLFKRLPVGSQARAVPFL